jgi:hypothetical protein
MRTEFFDVNLNLRLRKDLHENQILCTECNGLGLTIKDNDYEYLKDNRKVVKQTLDFCVHCNNGIQNVCKYCEKVLGKQVKCNCEKQRIEDSENINKKIKEKWDKTEKIHYQELYKNGYNNMIFVDNFDRYFVDIDELIEYLHDLSFEELDDIDELRIYQTSKIHLTFDAQSIIEDASSDLHEDACDYIDKSYYERIQEFLDNISNELKDETATYYYDDTKGIIFDINKYKQEVLNDLKCR